MSLQLEYRRLAAACLDLVKLAAAPADKTRLLLIAEAWLDLAERVTRKAGMATAGLRSENNVYRFGSDQESAPRADGREHEFTLRRPDMSGPRPKAT